MQAFDYYRPHAFDEAFQLLSRTGQRIVPVAGATDLIPQIRDGLLQPDAVVDVKGLPGLRDLKMETQGPCCDPAGGECLYIGAAVTMNEIARSELVQSHWDLLARAAASIGHEQVRNRATLGGNICTTSPAADTAPALYTLEASVQIKGPDGDRCLPIDQFFTGPRRNALRPGELVVGVLIPKPPSGTVGHHEKLSRRKAGDLAIVSVAVMAVPHDGGYSWRLAMGAVSPTPLRSSESEAILSAGYDDEAIDRAAAAAYGCTSPIEDIRSGIAYRQAMIVNLTRRAVKTVVDQLPTAQV